LAIHVALNHVTHYRYDRRVTLSPQLVRLRPAPHTRTPVLSYSLKVAPEPHFVNWQQDPQSNYLARYTFPDPVRELRIEVDLVTELAVYNPFDFFLEPHAEQIPFAYEPWQIHELQPFLHTTPLSPRFERYLGAISRKPRRTIDFLVDLNQQLQRDVRYVIRMDPGVQTVEETLGLGSGSCRDSTWLLVQLLRHLGLAARFVSGYLIQLTPDVKALEGPVGAEKDFTDLHAWCEVYLPGAGWIGLDPTSGLLAGEGHIPLACTPEPASAAPLSGGVDECEVEFEHSMAVTRIYESPRVTKPYTDEQWQAIVALGETVDADLRRGDVRLTMGGEPTFVAADDRDGDEWNMTALGPTKRLFATELLRRLKQHYGANGFVHFGQGKWYPGEQLPRWALGCFWRKDGEPAWLDPALVADERQTYGVGPPEAQRFLRTLATKLAVTDQHLQAGYEDVWYYLWRERRLPVNVDPFDSRLDDEMERERLRRVFTQRLDAVVGYAMPLTPARDSARQGGARWRTGPWFLRGERMYLMPGDSPMGYRLPLDSLPWATALDLPWEHERDPLDPRSPLPLALRGGLEPRRQPPAPPSAPKPATASCTCSCRQSARSRTIWISSPRWSRPPRRSGPPSCSRAIRRRTTRASPVSRSRPIPVSSR
jgi:transglutaminase-like putative cysteine protease